MALRSADRLDLNLLVVFDTIFSEGTLTRAGRKLGMTQSAVSHSLSRLREALGDPLFLRSRRGVDPTPRALELAPTVSKTVETLRSCFSGAESFDPSKATRVFALDLPAGLESLVLGPLEAQTAGASGLSFRIFNGRISDVRHRLAGDESHVAIDHLVPVGDEYRSEALFEDPYAILVRRRHPTITGPVSKAAYSRARHVALTWTHGFGVSPLDKALARIGVTRQARVTVPAVTAMPGLLSNSDLVATLPQRIATAIARGQNLAIYPLDFEVDLLTFHMIWHASADEDAGNMWLRGLLARILREL